MNPQDIAKKYGATFTPVAQDVSGTPVSETTSTDLQGIASKYGAKFTPIDSSSQQDNLVPNRTETDTLLGRPTAIPFQQSASGVFNALTSSEQGLSETVGQPAAVNLSPKTFEELGQSQQNLSDLQFNTIKRINEKKALGEDTTRLQALLDRTQQATQGNTMADIVPATQKTTGQALGEIGGTALDVLTAGTYKGATAGLKSFELATKAPLVPTVVEKGVSLLKNPTGIFTSKGLKAIGTGAGIGYGYDVTQGLQGGRGEDRTGVNSLVPGLGTVLGAGIPAAIEITGNGIPKLQSLVSGEKYVNDVKGDWEKVGSDFVRSSKVLSKAEARGKDPISMLSERGITPQSVVDGQTGKFNTVEVADKIRTQDTQPFEDVLQKSLKEADRSNTPIPIQDIKSNAINNIKNDPSLTLGQKDVLLSKVDNESKLLAENYRSGISRVDSNIEKRNFWQNTKFDRTAPLEKDFMYQMGRAFKEAIEKHTPDIDVQGINSYLGDLYESARFLDTLNGKVPKITRLQKVGRAITRAATTYIGGTLGGGLPGGAAGYIVGSSVSHALESMSNPIKSYFLRQLKVTNPEAYTQAVKYLGEREAQRLTTPLLEAPAKLGTEKNPIIPPAPTTFEKPAQRITQSTYNPKNKQYYEKGKIGGQDLKGGKNSNSTQMANISTNSNIPESVPQKPNKVINKGLNSASGGIAGLEIKKDENGKTTIKFNPEKALVGIVAMGSINRLTPKFKETLAKALVKDTKAVQLAVNEAIVKRAEDILSAANNPSMKKVISLEDISFAEKIKDFNPKLMDSQDRERVFSILDKSKENNIINGINNEVNQTIKNTIKPTTKEVIKEVKTVDPLLQEAKKYKSAEDFVKKQTPISHYTAQKFDKFDLNKTEAGSVWFTDNSKIDLKTGQGLGSAQVGTGGAKYKMERYVNPKAKIIDIEKSDLTDKYTTGQLINMGYAGVKVPQLDGSNWYEIFNPDTDLLTKSQLTDIFNRAHGIINK